MEDERAGAYDLSNNLPRDLLDSALGGQNESSNEGYGSGSACTDCKVNEPVYKFEDLRGLCVSCIVRKYSASSVPQDALINFGVKEDADPEYYDKGDLMSNSSKFSAEAWVERTKYIPVRLTEAERKKLRMLEAALNVSEYTDRVDVIQPNRIKRIVTQTREMCSIISGLTLASDYKKGQLLFETRDFVQNSGLYKEIFEIGRRYKIMNPDKMWSSYGKLMYMLQDSMTPEINEILKFSLVIPIKTVYTTLQSLDLLCIVEDPLIEVATGEVVADGKTRAEIKSSILKKENAVKTLIRRYTMSLSEELREEVLLCIYSISDYHTFLSGNVAPCEKILDYLQKYFKKDIVDEKYSLAIRSGFNGSRLSHTHSKQYTYVFQSLVLWREILLDMYRLWLLADEDFLSDDGYYRLHNTGQGLNRIKHSSMVVKHMMHILAKVRSHIGEWIGSTVIHMGDHNVPNALVFIDKYAQIHRILSPIVNVIKYVEGASWKETPISTYFKALDGPDAVCRNILSNFFCSAFDGSGADNSYDAGSCIDGRLTSAWNWCSLIDKKDFYPVFLLSGFTSFDRSTDY